MGLLGWRWGRWGAGRRVVEVQVHRRFRGLSRRRQSAFGEVPGNELAHSHPAFLVAVVWVPRLLFGPIKINNLGRQVQKKIG